EIMQATRLSGRRLRAGPRHQARFFEPRRPEPVINAAEKSGCNPRATVTKCGLQGAGVILAPALVRYATNRGQFMAKRRSSRSSSSFKIHTTPPGSTTVIISLIVFILGVIGALVFVPVL